MQPSFLPSTLWSSWLAALPWGKPCRSSTPHWCSLPWLQWLPCLRVLWISKPMGVWVDLINRTHAPTIYLNLINWFTSRRCIFVYRYSIHPQWLYRRHSETDFGPPFVSISPLFWRAPVVFFFQAQMSTRLNPTEMTSRLAFTRPGKQPHNELERSTICNG